jgi:hypothetical protein
MDLDPESAYAARRFFIPNAAAVLVWDMNEPLSLQDGSIGAIFCLDAFHYVTDKQALARRPGRSAARTCPHPQRAPATLGPPKAQTASRMTNEHMHAVSLSTV